MKETCQALIHPDDETVCGEPALSWVFVRTKVLGARVPVCGIHKAQHNRGFAKLRTSSKPR
jgi:hypothetical protein